MKWWFRHVHYRVCHYLKILVRFPMQQLDYHFGKFSYAKSPYFSHRSYREFSREHGRYGEFQLWRKARRALGKNTVWFRNLYLPKEDESTLEIDLVAVSCRGVFVFESKNYDGRIYGNEKYPNWFQMIRKDVRQAPRKYTFFNPIMQNAMHCRHLARILEEKDIPIYSYVVFGNRCTLKNIEYKKGKAVVCRQYSVAGHIRKHKRTLNYKRVSDIGQKLEGYGVISYKQKLAHVQAISNKHKNTIE